MEKGREAGLEQGLEQGRVAALLAVLEQRRVSVSEAQRRVASVADAAFAGSPLTP